MTTIEDKGGHKSWAFSVAEYSLEATNLVGSVGAPPTASCNINCSGPSIDGSGEITADIRFVETSLVRSPRRLVSGNFEFFMHCSMIPIVLAQFQLQSCVVTFEDKPGAPIGYVKGDGTTGK